MNKLPLAHDRSHRLLFSHSRVVRDLIAGFIREPWIEDLDLSTLESLPSDLVFGDLAGGFEERVSDVVWKVRWREHELFVVIILELQSTTDADMALRMATYVVLNYQRLRRAELIAAEKLLPPVLPIVFYNGDSPWSAPRELSQLIQPVPRGLARFSPSMRYLVIDEKRWSTEELAPDNVVSGMIRAEQAQSPEDLESAIAALGACIDDADDGGPLRRDLVAWLSKVVLPNRVQDLEVPTLADLYEFRTYLETNMHSWSEQWEAAGRQKGRQEGHREGRQEGRQEGRREALLSLIQLKFGPQALTEAQSAAIADGSPEQIERWTARILTAESVNELFE